jgi:hypothetical protein
MLQDIRIMLKFLAHNKIFCHDKHEDHFLALPTILLNGYGLSVATKSLAPGIATVGELRLMSQVGESVQNHVHIEQCVSAIRVVPVPVFLQTLICSNDTMVATIRAGCYQSTQILSDLCCLPSAAAAAAANGPASLDTWPLINGGCYHLTEIGGAYGL